MHKQQTGKAEHGSRLSVIQICIINYFRFRVFESLRHTCYSVPFFMVASTVDTTIQTLRDSLVDKAYLHEPWTSGVISLSEPEKILFYETEDGTPR